MSSVRFYALIYVALIALASAKVVFFEAHDFGYISYNAALGLTLVTAAIKTGLIAGYYQHLASEPRSLSYLMLLGLFAVMLLAFAAGFSIL